MRLHRTEVPDWSTVAPEQLNAWQHLAARTNGVVTPGNIISLVGSLLVVFGLYLVTHNHLMSGIIVILLGRWADVLDGLVAEITRTKSPLGEAADAALDKIVLGLALLVLLDQHLLPLLVGLVMLAQAAYNSVVSLLAKGQSVGIHPTTIGKLSTAFEWLCIGLYGLAYQINQHHSVARQVGLVMATVSFGLFVVLGILASADYSQQALRKAA